MVRRRCPQGETNNYLRFLINEYYGGEWKIEADDLKQFLKDNGLYKYDKESGYVDLDIPAVLVRNGKIVSADEPQEPKNDHAENAMTSESKELDAKGEEEETSVEPSDGVELDSNAPQEKTTAESTPDPDACDNFKSKADRIALFGIGKHKKSDFLQVPGFKDTEKFEAWKEQGRNEAIYDSGEKDGSNRIIRDLEEKIKKRDNSLAKVRIEADRKEQEHSEERLLLKNNLTIKTTKLESAEKEISRLKEEMEAFGKNVRMKPGLQQTATRIDAFLSNVDKLLRERDLLEASNKPADTSLALRINSKYAAAITRIDNLSDWRRDIANLAAAGIRLTGSKLITDSTDEASLLFRFHKDVASILGSAAMILADEYARSMARLYPGSRDTVKNFEELSRKLEDSLKELGYSVNHVRYGDMIPPGVKNEKFAENPELESNQIAEVYKLGISYGSSTEETTVSAKE